MRAFLAFGTSSTTIGPALAEHIAFLTCGRIHPDDAQEARNLIAEHWTRCDGFADSGPLLAKSWKRLGYISDTKGPLPAEMIVYRARYKGVPDRGLSWTLSLDIARWYVDYLGGSRARLCGMPTHLDREIVTQTVPAAEVLGWFNERGEHEIVLAPTRRRKQVRI